MISNDLSTEINLQIKRELEAAHQYMAIALWYEEKTLLQLARFFYRQSDEERGHGQMMMKYLLDRDYLPTLMQTDAPQVDFKNIKAPIELALAQERKVSDCIKNLVSLSRDEGDYLTEQFFYWFLKEQVEEEASMSSLLDASAHSSSLLELEDWVSREMVAGQESDAPEKVGE